MNIAMNSVFISRMAAVALLAACAGAEAAATEAERANADIVKSYLGVEEAARAGVVSVEPIRTAPLIGPGIPGADLERSRVLAPLPASNRLSNLFEKRRVKAVKGDVAAQFNLGMMYVRGEGVSQDFKEAAKWLRNPAEQGYDVAQFTLGEIYAGGKGVDQDYGEAASWYLRAAEQGNARAQHRIGLMYTEGKGVRYSPRDAERWLHKAAGQGDAKIQFDLGERYASGQGVPVNAKEAEKWFREAAGQGDAEMQFFLGRLYREPGELVAQDREEALSWFVRAAEQGHAGAKLNLGVMYLNGEGIQIDMVQAHKWLTLAAASDGEKEVALKNLQVAEIRMSGEQIKEAKRQAAEWLAQHKSAAKYSAPARAVAPPDQRSGYPRRRD